jgi:hypothetical protein
VLGDQRTIGSIPCQIVFTQDGPGVVLLDCVVAEVARLGKQLLQPGTPFTVEAAVPEAAWLHGAKNVLDRWAADGSTVTLEFRQRRDRSQLVASDGVNSMLLDLQVADGST